MGFRPSALHTSVMVLVASVLTLSTVAVTGCARESDTVAPETNRAAGYSVTMESTTPDGVTSVAEVQAVEGAYRTEIMNGRRASIFIVHFDRDLVWLLVPEDQTYFTLGLDSLSQDIPNFFASDLAVERSEQTPETIEGTETIRSTVVTGGPGGVHRGTLWESVALPGRPVKWVDAESGLITVFKGYRSEEFDPSFFEVPEGYAESEPTRAP